MTMAHSPSIPVDLDPADLKTSIDLAVKHHRLIRKIVMPEHPLVAAHQSPPELTMRPVRSSDPSFGITMTPGLPSITFSPLTSISTKLDDVSLRLGHQARSGTRTRRSDHS